MSDEVLKEALSDAGVIIPSDEKLRSISQLVNAQIMLQAKVERLTQELKEANAELEQVQTKALPEALLDLEVTKFESPRFKIKLEKVYFASVLKDQREDFYNWVDEQGDHGVITSTVVIEFGRGGRHEAKEFLEWLHRQNVPHATDAVLVHDMHWQTMRAYARDKVEEGVELHPGFKVHAVDKAKLEIKGV